MDEKETEKIETYFVEALGCLLDVRMALNAAKMGASIEKGSLTRVGRDFGYQQGIIDVCDELISYASGEVKLQDAIDELMEAKQRIMGTEQIPEERIEGMDVV